MKNKLPGFAAAGKRNALIRGFYLSTLILAFAFSALLSYRAGIRSPIHINPNRVTSIDVKTNHWSSRFPDACVQLTTHTQIRDFCRKWNAEWATQVEPAHLVSGTPRVDIATGAGFYIKVVCNLKNNEKRTYYLGDEFTIDAWSDVSNDLHVFYFSPNNCDLVDFADSLLFPDRYSGAPHSSEVQP